MRNKDALFIFLGFLLCLIFHFLHVSRDSPNWTSKGMKKRQTQIELGKLGLGGLGFLAKKLQHPGCSVYLLSTVEKEEWEYGIHI